MPGLTNTSGPWILLSDEDRNAQCIAAHGTGRVCPSGYELRRLRPCQVADRMQAEGWFRQHADQSGFSSKLCRRVLKMARRRACDTVPRRWLSLAFGTK